MCIEAQEIEPVSSYRWWVFNEYYSCGRVNGIQSINARVSERQRERDGEIARKNIRIIPWTQRENDNGLFFKKKNRITEIAGNNKMDE